MRSIRRENLHTIYIYIYITIVFETRMASEPRLKSFDNAFCATRVL